MIAGPLFSFQQFYRNMRIKHKLFLLITLIMLFFYCVTYMVLQYAYSIYDEQLYDRSSQVLNLSSNSIETELRKIEKLSFNIVTDPTIQSRLQVMRSETSEYPLYKAKEELVERLALYTGAEKYAYSVDLFDMTGHIHTAGRYPQWTPNLIEEVWEKAQAGEGEMRWIYPKGGDSTSLMATRLVRSYNSNLSLDLEPIGVLTIRIRVDQIVRDVSSGTELGKGELRITSSENHLIYPIGEAVTAGALTPSAVKTGYEIKEENGHNVFLSHVHSNYTGWTYYSRIPFDTIFKKIVWMKNMLIVIFVVTFVLMLLLSLQVARSITRPMEGLINRMKQVQRGDLTVPELTELPGGASLPMDEVGHLHRTFRMMIQQIDELITENYAKQLTIKESQFRALQAQINPHFLYNTLESINWEAKMGGQPQISRMVEALGFLLRSSISQKQSMITLGQELDLIRHYITIQQYRFEERLVFELEVPQELYPVPIPKLTLQPLVENAIHHALERKVDPCLIRIFAIRDDKGITICVEDDGPGMIPEMLEKVRKGEIQTQGNGIGLANIRDRIILAFGEPYGLDINSEAGIGTQVQLYIPIERRDSHVQDALSR